MIKKIFAVAVIALTSLSFNAMAQGQKAGKKLPGNVKMEQRAHRGDMRVAEFEKIDLFKDITLTSEQKAKVDKLRDKEHKERGEAKEKASKERKQRMEKHDKELKKILTPDQYKQYSANKKALEEARKDGKFAKRHKGGKDGKFDKRGKGNIPTCKDSIKKPCSGCPDSSLPAPGTVR